MKEPRPEFDRFAHHYRSMHKDSIQIGGEEPEYYASYKAKHAARRHGASSKPRTLLDFGCGIGGMTRHLANAFPGTELIGVDVSSESIAIAREAHGNAARFMPIEGNRLPMEDASVDAAIAACVFHHIPPEARLSWTRELRRVVRPGGHLFIYEHNPLNPLTRKVVRDCVFDADAILLPQGETRALLQDAGFSEVENDYIVFFPHGLGVLRPLEQWLSALPLGAQYATWGRA